jgi:RNA polymerase sigma factor (sigma-70 family)
MKTSKLTPEAEQALFDEWSSRVDGSARISARNSIVEAHLWLVSVVSREYRCSAAERSDLIGEGHLGLLHAFERFDRTLGVRFATYARYWIQSSMSAFLLRTTNALGSLARSRAERDRRREAAAGRQLGLDGHHHLRDVSLDAPSTSDDDRALHERLLTDDWDVDARIECGRRSVLVSTAVAELLTTFDRRERVVYQARFHDDETSGEPVAVAVVAEQLGLSRARARQLEGRVRMKLANHLRVVLGPEWADSPRNRD